MSQVARRSFGAAGRASRLRPPNPARRLAAKHGLLAVVVWAAFLAQSASAQAPALPNLAPMPNDSGYAATYSLAGVIDQTGPFFQSLGSNGRSCSSCHLPAEGWTITPRGVQARFAMSGGTDPIFRTVDGANSPLADVSSLRARRSAYGMLLSKGLIRVGIGIPAGAEFELVAVDDPYGYASAAELSLFRRPLPTTNLGLLSTVMWDGRETFKDARASDCIAGSSTCFAAIPFDLSDQSNTATLGHAQAGMPLTDAQRAAIVTFESQLFTAQVFDRDAGPLTARGARGGPVALPGQTFYFGINDTLAGDYQTHLPFTPTAMTLYDAWAQNSEAAARSVDGGEAHERRPGEGQRAVARGQALFNRKPIQISGVSGLNDDLGITTLNGTCTTCHNAPNAGNHSVPMPLAIGVADASRRTADLPLYTLRNLTTGATTQVTDPGRALVSGKWKDIGRFKGPVLRALATRAPYFHNGMAKDLGEAVDFYNTRFGIGLTARERADLIAFLKTL
jgi:mono/diheme cytochrome c family protein